jgi:hypothetical protein
VRDVLIRYTFDPGVNGLLPARRPLEDLPRPFVFVFHVTGNGSERSVYVSERSTGHGEPSGGDAVIFETREAISLEPALSTGRLIWRHARQWVDPGDQMRALDAVADAGGEISLRDLVGVMRSPTVDHVQQTLALIARGYLWMSLETRLLPATRIRLGPLGSSPEAIPDATVTP